MEKTITLQVKAVNFGMQRTVPFTQEGIEQLRKWIKFLEDQFDNIIGDENGKIQQNKDSEKAAI